MGAWIETKTNTIESGVLIVAPYVGAWIETKFETKGFASEIGRTLRGCVD